MRTNVGSVQPEDPKAKGKKAVIVPPVLAPLGGVRLCSYCKITVADRTESSTAQGVQAVDQDECASQVLPPLGDGVPHPVQAHVELLDYVTVAVTNVGGPGQEEVISWFPHALECSYDRKDSVIKGT